MKAIIRTRKVEDVNKKLLDFLNKNYIDYKICVHPLGKSFAEFHNDIFRQLDDEVYLFFDDDCVPSRNVFALENLLLGDESLVAVCGKDLPNDWKIARIKQLCFKQNFNFFCTVVHGKFLRENVRIPFYLECSEDDYVKKRILEENKAFQVAKYFFIHECKDWNKKLVEGLRWHVANQTMHYLNNGGVTDELCLQEMTLKSITAFANSTHSKAARVDRKIAYSLKCHIIQGFLEYAKYIKNR